MQDNLPKNIKGFTLLELLIVIAIIAILSAILVFILNPAEILRKARNSQRISDLNSIHRAIAFLITTKPGILDNCESSNIWVSIPTSSGIINPPADPETPTSCGQTGWVPGGIHFQQVDDPHPVDGSGWIPLNFTQIGGGSPIARLPIDPTNTDDGCHKIDCPEGCLNPPRDFYYSFRCSPNWMGPNKTYELNAILESKQFREIEDRDGNDGGTAGSWYEVGTKLDVLWNNWTN